jgi:demethylmenaquinone methyltransferase/2-methoxy-6-polyprenyl-1,4-benzoquinol methylase
MTAQARTPLSGSRPEGTQSEQEASQHVRRMFSDIAGRYDLLNHLLSCNLDRAWRRRTARAFDHILRLPQARVLDLCCGTGDLALALARQAAHSGRPGATILASDFAHPMLERAAAKRRAHRGEASANAGGIGYFGADALRLPLPDAACDLITVAFGFRNLANYEAGLREMLRLLRPGGEVGILEFAEPEGPAFGALYRFYFRRILPLVGRAISGSTGAYSYLPASVSKFPPPEMLREMMSRAGFVEARFELWTGGTVALHTGRKPGV